MENVAEEWRVVEGTNGKIRVNRMGSVQSRTSIDTDWRDATLTVMKNGYLAVHIPLSKRREYVHALVTRAFLGPRPDGLVTDHKNADKKDNRVGNLEYVTNDENMRRAAELGRFKRGSCHYASKMTEESARIAVAMLHGGAEQAYVASKMGVGKKTISDIVCRKTWKHLNLNTAGLRKRNRSLENAS